MIIDHGLLDVFLGGFLLDGVLGGGAGGDAGLGRRSVGHGERGSIRETGPRGKEKKVKG